MEPRKAIPTVLLLTLVACGLLSAAAGAQEIPPGNSGADQYTEGVPGAEGDKPSSDPSDSDSGEPESSGLPPAASNALASADPIGTEVAAVLGASSPGTDSGGGGQAGANGEGKDSSISQPASGPSESFPSTAVAALSSDDEGMGLMLPLLLIISLVAVLGAVLARRSKGTDSGGA